MRLVTTVTGAAMLALAALLAGAPSLGVAGAATTPTTLVVSGSSTLAPLMTDIARRFESRTPGVTVEIQAVGSGTGVSRLRSGHCDVAMISRPVAEGEKDLYAFPLARDGGAVVVNRANRLRSITAVQLRGVLTGKITDWSELGGRPGKIRVGWRPEGQGFPEILLQHLKLKNDQIRSQAILFDNASAVGYAAENRDAVSFAAVGLAERFAREGAPVRLLAYEGVPATQRAVSDHTYPLSRPLILLTRTVPSGAQKLLIDYATSKAVTDLLEAHGHVPYRD